MRAFTIRFCLNSYRHSGRLASPEPRRAPFRRRLARFNRKVANPAMRNIAGSFGPFAIVRHRGRRTGREYATPVLAFGTDDELVVGVLYGITSDWVKNVLAANRAEVRWHGQSREYEQPQLISSEEGLARVPAVIRGPYRLLGVRNFVRLTPRR